MKSKINILDIAIMIMIFAVCFSFAVVLIKDISSPVRDTSLALAVDRSTAALLKPGEKAYLDDREGRIISVESAGDESMAIIEFEGASRRDLPKIGEKTHFTTKTVYAECTVYSVTETEGDGNEK